MLFFYFDTEDKYNPYFVWHLRLDLRMGAGSISTEVHAIFAQMLSCIQKIIVCELKCQTLKII